MGWNTDTKDFMDAVTEFEELLPGFWWSVGQCSVGAHASCGVDVKGEQGHLLDGVETGHPFDFGYHFDTIKGSPSQALRGVMAEAVLDVIQRNLADA